MVLCLVRVGYGAFLGIQSLGFVKKAGRKPRAKPEPSKVPTSADTSEEWLKGTYYDTVAKSKAKKDAKNAKAA